MESGAIQIKPKIESEEEEREHTLSSTPLSKEFLSRFSRLNTTFSVEEQYKFSNYIIHKSSNPEEVKVITQRRPRTRSGYERIERLTSLQEEKPTESEAPTIFIETSLYLSKYDNRTLFTSAEFQSVTNTQDLKELQAAILVGRRSDGVFLKNGKDKTSKLNDQKYVAKKLNAYKRKFEALTGGELLVLSQESKEIAKLARSCFRRHLSLSLMNHKENWHREIEMFKQNWSANFTIFKKIESEMNSSPSLSPSSISSPQSPPIVTASPNRVTPQTNADVNSKRNSAWQRVGIEDLSSCSNSPRNKIISSRLVNDSSQLQSITCCLSNISDSNVIISVNNNNSQLFDNENVNNQNNNNNNNNNDNNNANFENKCDDSEINNKKESLLLEEGSKELKNYNNGGNDNQRDIEILLQIKKKMVTDAVATRDRLFSEIEQFYEPIISWIPRYQFVITDELEIILFSCFHVDLQFIYNTIYKEQNKKIYSLMQQYQTVMPVHLGVQKPFWLIQHSLNEQQTPPYAYPIKLLHSVINKLPSPFSKLLLLKRVGREIFKSVTQFYNLFYPDVPTSKLTMGADELMPLLSYVIMKCNINNLYSQLQMINDFISEYFVKGEECYYLVSFDTALSFVECLELEQFENIALTLLTKIRAQSLKIRIEQQVVT